MFSSFFQLWYYECKKLKQSLVKDHIPKVTKPALAESVSLGAPSSSWGAVGDHEQEGALLREAARLASTNCYTMKISKTLVPTFKNVFDYLCLPLGRTSLELYLQSL